MYFSNFRRSLENKIEGGKMTFPDCKWQNHLERRQGRASQKLGSSPLPFPPCSLWRHLGEPPVFPGNDAVWSQWHGEENCRNLARVLCWVTGVTSVCESSSCVLLEGVRRRQKVDGPRAQGQSEEASGLKGFRTHQGLVAQTLILGVTPSLQMAQETSHLPPVQKADQASYCTLKYSWIQRRHHWWKAFFPGSTRRGRKKTWGWNSQRLKECFND